MDEGTTFPLPVRQNLAWDSQVKPLPTGVDVGPRATFLTIATLDRAGQSRIFARSARMCHPDARLVVLVAGDTVPRQVFDDLFDLVLPVGELSLGGLADMQFRYSTAELCFALKPWAIRHLLDRYAGDPIYYFDSDIELFSPLAEAQAALARGANLVLTPHILQPGLDSEREKALLRSGSFNAGFLGVAPSTQARAFVTWWCERVRTGCTHDPLEGTYGDQKWLELAPSLCEGVTVLRHPGYNFAYWNAHERPLSCLGGVWTTAGWPLRFVHYSRWDLREQDADQYLADFFTREYERFADIFADYRQKVRDESGTGELPALDGGEPRAPSGERISEIIRNAYARHATAVDGGLVDVFGHAVAVLGAPSRERADLPDLPVTILYDEVWRRHADLRYRFDIDRENGRLAYLRWLVQTGAAQLGIPAVFLALARSAVERARVRELEAGDETMALLPAASAPAPSPSLPATTETIAALIAARDAERERSRLQHDDIRLLVRSNKSLRREVQGLRVGRWRDEETIQALESELAQTRRARDNAALRGRELAGELSNFYARPWRSLLSRKSRRTSSFAAGPNRRQILEGDSPFFERGFLHSEASTIADGSVKRIKDAPSGTFIFGPYVSLPPGIYAVSIAARLYRPLPVSTSFKLDVVHDGGRQVVELRNYRLRSIAGWRRFELVFAVGDGEEAPDFEFRVWARQGTPLQVGAIDVYELCEERQLAAATP